MLHKINTYGLSTDVFGCYSGPIILTLVKYTNKLNKLIINIWKICNKRANSMQIVNKLLF